MGFDMGARFLGTNSLQILRDNSNWGNLAFTTTVTKDEKHRDNPKDDIRKLSS